MYVFSYGHLFLATDNKNICRTLGIKDILRVVAFLREGTITPLT